MNKKTKVVIGAVVIVALFIIALAINFPPVFKGKSSGTFGKADRYHKSQMSEKDILLRSKLTSDTVELKKMLQGLVYFTVFTKDLCIKIDNCVTVFQEQGLNSKDPGYPQLMLLSDYSSFIKNNNETLGKTISLLKGFYFKESADESADVEKTVRDFGNYVKTLGERDDVLETALKGMDNFLLSSNIMKERKDELKKLKSIRDQLLMQGIQLAGLVQDNAMGTRLLSYSLSSQQQLQFYQAQDNLQIHAQDKLQAGVQEKLQFWAGEKLQLTGSQEINTHFTAREPGLSVIVYNRESLSFFAWSREDLNAAQSSLHFDATQNLQISFTGIGDINVAQVGIVSLGILANDGLKVFLYNYDLQGNFEAIGLGAVNSMQLEGLYTGQGALGVFVSAADILNSLQN